MLSNFLLPPDFELPIAVKSPIFATPGDGRLLVCSTHDAYRLRCHYQCDTLQEVQMRARLAGTRLDIWQSEREAAHMNAHIHGCEDFRTFKDAKVRKESRVKFRTIIVE